MAVSAVPGAIRQADATQGRGAMGSAEPLDKLGDEGRYS